eukprot:220615_1
MAHLILQTFAIVSTVVYAEYYSLNGSNNNIEHPNWGTINTVYRRLPNEHNKLSYINQSYQINNNLPNPRLISNSLGQLPKRQSKYSKFSPLSGIAWAYSKSISQELCKTTTQRDPTTFYPIKVPPCDWYWDYNCTNKTIMPFWRSQQKIQSINNITYPTPINKATAFIDLHYLYGVQESESIRLYTDGLIKTNNLYPQTFNTSDQLINQQLKSTGHITAKNLDINTFYAQSIQHDISIGGIHAAISGYTTTECPFFAGGATKFTEIEYLWKLNHNRIAKELKANTNITNDEWLFQEARRFSIATVQHITYTEYLPLFLAYPIINNITYNSSVDPSVSTWFCGLAHRYSHPATPNEIPFAGYHNNKSQPIYGEYINETISSIAIRDAVTYPCFGIDDVKNNNQSDNVYVEALLGGLMLESENLVSPKHNEFVRSYLQHAWYTVDVQSFSLPNGTRGTDGQVDLFALDILRSRDWGIPSYNDARELFNLSRIETWEELTDNELYLEILPQLYENINDLDAYVGALLEQVEADYEDSRNGSAHVGPMFAAMLRDQYWRSAVGDRLFYIHNETLRNYTQGLTLSKIIELNTNLKELSTDIFTADAKNKFNQHSAPEGQSMTVLNDIVHVKWFINEEDNWILFNVTLKCNENECDSPGWFGIGFGDGGYMKGHDIAKINFEDGTFVAMDAYCPHNKWIPMEDGGGDKQQDVIFESGMVLNNEITFAFRRPLDKHKQDGLYLYDYPIKKGKHCCSIIAYNFGDHDAKHASDHRTVMEIDYYTGETDEQCNSFTDTYLTHGVMMILLFAFCYPAAAFVAHYLKHFAWARERHMMVAELGFSMAFTSAIFAATNSSSYNGSVHAALGITCMVLLIVQGSIGHVISYWLDNLNRAKYFDKIKYMHIFCASCILIISPFTIWEGWKLYGSVGLQIAGFEFTIENVDNSQFKALLIVWYVIVILCFIGGETYIRIWPKFAKQKGTNMFNVHNYHIYSWSEIGEKVSSGAAWIIIDNAIYDVTEWQYSHPGGRQILIRYFGVDATEFFHGKKKVGESHGNVFHAHSDYARAQLAKIIVGEVDCGNKKQRPSLILKNSQGDIVPRYDKDGNTIQVEDSNDLTKYLSEESSETYTDPRQLTVITLLNKQIVSKKKRSSRKIVLFEFDYDVIEHNIEFDGDYILLHEVADVTISRAYTPVKGEFILSDSEHYDTFNQEQHNLFLVIRLYKCGRMSQILDKLQIGDTIRITGPFRRAALLPSITNKLFIYPDKNWIDNFLIKLVNNATIEEMKTAKQQLQQLQYNGSVQKNTYWKKIVLICGGTGITPMFNILQHHLDNADNTEIRVNLIWVNRTLDDICFESQIKYYKSCNKKRFWIDLKFTRLSSIDDIAKWGKWATLHTKTWDTSEIIDTMTHFFKTGKSRMSKDLVQSTGNAQKVEINKDGAMYKSLDVYTDDEDKEEVEQNEEKKSQDIELNEINNDVSNAGGKNSEDIAQNAILISGPRPFVDKIRNSIWRSTKHGTLNKYINIKKQLISLD